MRSWDASKLCGPHTRPARWNAHTDPLCPRPMPATWPIAGGAQAAASSGAAYAALGSPPAPRGKPCLIPYPIPYPKNT